MQDKKLLYSLRISGLIQSKATVRFIQVPWGRNPELQEVKPPRMPVSLTRVVCLGAYVQNRYATS